MPKIGFSSILGYFGDLRRHKGAYFWAKLVSIPKNIHNGLFFHKKIMQNFNHFFSITISKYQISVKFGFETGSSEVFILEWQKKLQFTSISKPSKSP